MAKVKGKVVLSVYVDRKVVEEAKAAGLNLSKTCENALKSAAKALRKTYASNGVFSGRAFVEQKCGGAAGGIRTRAAGLGSLSPNQAGPRPH